LIRDRSPSRSRRFGGSLGPLLFRAADLVAGAQIFRTARRGRLRGGDAGGLRVGCLFEQVRLDVANQIVAGVAAAEGERFGQSGSDFSNRLTVITDLKTMRDTPKRSVTR